MDKCYYHPEKEVVGQCASCGRFLCYDCFNVTQGHLCYECAQQLNYQIKQEFKSNLILAIVMGIAWIVGVLLINLFDSDTMYYIGVGLILVTGFIPGWRIATKILDKIFSGWIIGGLFLLFYYIIKFIIALLFAEISIVIYVIKTIISSVAYNKAKKNFELIEEYQKELVKQD